MSDRSQERHGENKVVHEYGDIQEYDNKLPTWWLWTLYGSVIFGIGYWFYYHGLGAGELPVAELRRETVEAAKRAGKGADENTLVALSADTSALKDGKEGFVTFCAPCHAPTGGGTIGPNLTDEYWIHGGDPMSIYKTMKDGVVAKGMPAWGPQLGEAKTQAVSAYVLSLRNTNVPGGKAPQGEKFAGR